MKQAHILSEDEKRNFFRIDDIAILQYKPVNEETVRAQQLGTAAKHVDRLTLKARFDSMSRECQPMLKMIAKSNGRIADYLEIIDQKINMLSECVLEDELSEMNVEPQHINIGAGGLSFSTAAPIMTGAMLELRMVLLPENTGIFSYVRVVMCSKLEEATEDCHQYRVALEFINMEDDVRDLITKHVLCKEQRMLTSEHSAGT